jgi:hypothetical protein
VRLDEGRLELIRCTALILQLSSEMFFQTISTKESENGEDVMMITYHNQTRLRKEATLTLRWPCC